MGPRRAERDRDPYWDDDRRRPPPPPLSSRGRRNSRSISPARSFTSRGSWGARSRSRSPPGRRGLPPYGRGGDDHRRGGGYPDSPPRRRPFSRSPPRESASFSSPPAMRYGSTDILFIQPTCVEVVLGVAVRRVATEEEDLTRLHTTAVGGPHLPVAEDTDPLADGLCHALHLLSTEEAGGGTGRRRRRHLVVGLTDPDRDRHHHHLPVPVPVAVVGRRRGGAPSLALLLRRRRLRTRHSRAVVEQIGADHCHRHRATTTVHDVTPQQDAAQSRESTITTPPLRRRVVESAARERPCRLLRRRRILLPRETDRGPHPAVEAQTGSPHLRVRAATVGGGRSLQVLREEAPGCGTDPLLLFRWREDRPGRATVLLLLLPRGAIPIGSGSASSRLDRGVGSARSRLSSSKVLLPPPPRLRIRPPLARSRAMEVLVLVRFRRGRERAAAAGLRTRRTKCRRRGRGRS